MKTPPRWDPSDYRTHGRFVHDRARSLLDLLSPRPGERVLDLGCGTGELTAAIAATGADVLGIDASPEMVAAARKGFPAIRFEPGDGHALTFDAEFDAVFSNAALHWMTRPRDVVEGIRRALKPGGRIAVEFGGHGNVAIVRKAVEGVLAGWKIDSAPWLPWYFPTEMEYAGLLAGRGFRVNSAVLFERPTRMEGGEDGLHAWLRLFTAALLDHLGPRETEFVARVADACRKALFRDGAWWVDYVRLRVTASRA